MELSDKKMWKRRFGKTVKMFLVLLFAAIFCLDFFPFDKISLAEEGAAQVTLNPVQDSYIQHNYPYFDPFHHPSCYNYGGSPNLITASDGQSNHPHILVQFDLSGIPDNAEINSACLKLYCYSGGGWKTIGCYSLTRGWVEGTMNQMWDPPREIANGVTWNTYDGIGNWTIPGGDYAPFLLDEVFIANNFDVGWKTWNVTPAVETRVNGALPNYGFILMTLSYANYWGASFYSKEYSDSTFWPRLEVSYELPEESLINSLSVTPKVFDPYKKDSELEISYELKEDSLVKIELFNSEGEKVKSLFEDLVGGEEIDVEEEQGAGDQTKQWCGVIDFEEMALSEADKGVLLAPNDTYTVRVTARSKNAGTVESAEAAVKVKSE